MNMLSTLLVIVAINSSVSIAYAQDCTDVALALAQETYRAYGGSRVYVVEKSDLCTASYESANREQRAQIKIGYDLLSGGANGSSSDIQTMQSRMCQSHYGSYWNSQVTSIQIQKASTDRAQIMRDCFNSAAFHLVSLEFQGDALSAAFRFGGPGQTIINGVELTPARIGKCTVLLDGRQVSGKAQLIGHNLSSGHTLDVTCERIGESSPGSKPAITVFRAGILTVATEDNSVTIPLSQYVYSAPLAPESAIARLQSELSRNQHHIISLEKRISDLGHGVDEQIVPSDPKFPPNTQTRPCPPGAFLSTIKYRSDRGGSHGITSGLYPVCRDLK